MSQLWTSFEKAHQITLKYSEHEEMQTRNEELIEYAKTWCHYLQRICHFLDHKADNQLTRKITPVANKQ